ncbi:hypothetical protein CMUS01_12687 [Colletotrichum musicola]|uniref:Uncharacterized protein n=1 Tax=Colletotrichum musicola TaxID=2175873 RepID=A0A8H6MYY4_9PEZI|nr:hypothetical protein CMUS01_12687 [Colletotrichum musicola]
MAGGQPSHLSIISVLLAGGRRHPFWHPHSSVLPGGLRVLPAARAASSSIVSQPVQFLGRLKVDSPRGFRAERTKERRVEEETEKVQSAMNKPQPKPEATTSSELFATTLGDSRAELPYERAWRNTTTPGFRALPGRRILQGKA